MHNGFGNVFAGRTVLITGHTGFKGSWLALWLCQMRADVIGYSLRPPTRPNHYSLLDLDMTSVTGDIRDTGKLSQTFGKYRPEIVFHLSAQPLVRDSYKNPVDTYETNVIGTLKIFEACRKHGVRAIINVTSDKCYRNNEWVWKYREDDPVGGHDPYSSSKGCAELLTSSYRDSFFSLAEYQRSHHTLMASCRAGNVIGGGDWAKDRLIPDIVRSASRGKPCTLRNPESVRPWQHVLEPLSGYLRLGQNLLEGNPAFSGPWNFGPAEEEDLSVSGVAEIIRKYWEKADFTTHHDPTQVHEAMLLTLDSSKARTLLHWRPIWNSREAIEKTILWYRDYYESGRITTLENLEEYIREAKKKKLAWTR